MADQAFHWNDIRFFLAVARSRTIPLAGRRIGTDHATVGRRITALEQSLGLKLFERNPRGYNLTHHGEALLGMASAMETEADRIGESAAGQHIGVAGARYGSARPKDWATSSSPHASANWSSTTHGFRSR